MEAGVRAEPHLSCGNGGLAGVRAEPHLSCGNGAVETVSQSYMLSHTVNSIPVSWISFQNCITIKFIGDLSVSDSK